MRFELVICPVDDCGWTLNPDAKQLGPVAVFDGSMTVAERINAGVSIGRAFAKSDVTDALSAAISAAALNRAQRLERRIREHMESHDVLDYLRTIRRLEQDLAQRDCGIRPHIPGHEVRG